MDEIAEIQSSIIDLEKAVDQTLKNLADAQERQYAEEALARHTSLMNQIESDARTIKYMNAIFVPLEVLSDYAN